MAKKLPPDDQKIWESFVKDIRPLEKDIIIPEVAAATIAPRKLHIPTPTIGKNQTVETLHSNDLKNVRLDGKLDLHGFTQTAAENAVRSFLKAAIYKNWRWVCIITGKGSPNNPSVLREQTPKWLGAMPELVTGYAHAKPEDGGTGAFYVKLRRKVTLR